MNNFPLKLKVIAKLSLVDYRLIEGQGEENSNEQG